MNESEIAAELAKANSGVKGLENKFADMNSLFMILVIALFIGFASTFIAAAGMLVEAWNGKQASYERVMERIDQLDKKIGSNQLFLKI